MSDTSDTYAGTDYNLNTGTQISEEKAEGTAFVGLTSESFTKYVSSKPKRSILRAKIINDQD